MKKKRWQHRNRSGKAQFSLRLLMMIMVVFAIAAAVLGGLLRKGPDRYIFIVLGLIAPIILMIVLSLLSTIQTKKSTHHGVSDFEEDELGDTPQIITSVLPETNRDSNFDSRETTAEKDKQRFRDKYS